MLEQIICYALERKVRRQTGSAHMPGPFLNPCGSVEILNYSEQAGLFRLSKQFPICEIGHLTKECVW